MRSGHNRASQKPPVAERSGLLFSIIQAAGWPIWPLLLCSVVAMAVVIERVTSLRQQRVAPPTLLDEVISVTRASLPAADVVNKLQANSVLGVVLATGLRAVIAEPPAQLDQLPVGRVEVEQARGAPEHRAADHRRLAAGVLQAEVEVAAARARHARQLAANRAGHKTCGKRFGHCLNKRRNAPNRAPGRRRQAAREALGQRLNHRQTQQRRGPRTPQPRRLWLGGPHCLSQH